MAQNITLLGADYPAVPAVELPKTGGGTATFTDVTDTTAAAADVASGKYFYTAAGVLTEGTASGGGGAGVVVVDTPDAAGGTIREITAVVLSSDTVTANVMLSGYTAHNASGTAITGNIATKTSSDLSASGDTVTVPAGYYASNATKAVSSGTAGTPSASKGAVSNHSIAVTPSVTNTSGYITGSTITGMAVSVSASELVSGSQTITSNGTVDVTNLAEVVVNVSGSTGKNVQVEHGTKRIAATAYTDVGYEITVAKTGTYNAYWAGWRSSTSGTNGAQLYVNGEASGSAVTTFDATWTNVQNGSRTSVSLTQGDKVTLRARSRGTSYYMYIFFLSIEEI